MSTETQSPNHARWELSARFVSGKKCKPVTVNSVGQGALFLELACMEHLARRAPSGRQNLKKISYRVLWDRIGSAARQGVAHHWRRAGSYRRNVQLHGFP